MSLKSKRSGSTDPNTEIEASIPEVSCDTKKPVLVRIHPDMLARIDLAAKRLGLSRSAFIISSVAERVERMG